jgi:hypothetical protein
MNSARPNPAIPNTGPSLRAKAMRVAALGLMATAAATYVAGATPITAVM